MTPRRRTILRALILVIACGGGALTARADMAPELPQTHWNRGEAPKLAHVVIPGVCLSIAAGLGILILVRRPGVKTIQAFLLIMTLMAGLIASATATSIFAARILDDEEQWNQYYSVIHRPHWRPGPHHPPELFDERA